jgi:Leu/Phe-tRNA-protein transferase
MVRTFAFEEVYTIGLFDYDKRDCLYTWSVRKHMIFVGMNLYLSQQLKQSVAKKGQ